MGGILLAMAILVIQCQYTTSQKILTLRAWDLLVEETVLLEKLWFLEFISNINRMDFSLILIYVHAQFQHHNEPTQ